MVLKLQAIGRLASRPYESAAKVLTQLALLDGFDFTKPAVETLIR